MAQNTENTFSAYLGSEFQQKLIWQLLSEIDFSEKYMNKISVDYFDDPHIKKIFIIIQNFYKDHEKYANILNNTIDLAIKKYYSQYENSIEEEIVNEIIKKVKLWNEGVYNKTRPNDSEIIKKETITFIKQQEYRKMGEFIINKVKTGEFRKDGVLSEIEDKLKKISEISDDEDYGTEVIENVDSVLTEQFREPIPTGITILDTITMGGLGKGEMGLILTPSGLGKTTILTKIANTAYDLGKNVLQIIFEDTEDQIKRKHFTIWSGVKLSEIDSRRDEVYERVTAKINTIKQGRLVIKKFSQENTSMRDIRNWISRYEKRFGFKFDQIILDYLDCVESDIRLQDKNEAELRVVKSFLALIDDLNVPGWSAIQANRGGFNTEYLEVSQMGGSIKRYQKAHLFMSVGKTVEQRKDSKVNIKILKARMVKDGQQFKNSIVDNDMMNIELNDDEHDNMYTKMSNLPPDVIEKMKTKFKALNDLDIKLPTKKKEDNVKKSNSVSDSDDDIDFNNLDDFISNNT